MFMMLFNIYKTTVTKNEAIAENADYKEIGYFQISGMFRNRDYYFEILEIGESMTDLQTVIKKPITLTEVLAIKQYLSIYLLTLAVRDFKSDSTLRLTNFADKKNDSENDK
jgi:hypothetical protein